MSSLIKICSVDELEPETVVGFELPNCPRLAVYLIAGKIFVTDDLCTHGNALLSEGFIEGGEIECPLHAGRFCIATGMPTAMPAESPLRRYDVVIEDGFVCIPVPEDVNK
jgi:ethylbenzene dioxygenase ferredoxin subunit